MEGTWESEAEGKEGKEEDIEEKQEQWEACCGEDGTGVIWSCGQAACWRYGREWCMCRLVM